MPTAPSISYSITIRLEVPSGGSAVSELTTTVERTGGIVTALDVTASGAEALRIDLTCAASDTDHAALIVSALEAISDVKVDKVSDRTFLMHLGGVIETATKHPLRNRDDLSMIYTPGVARICMAIAADKEDARRLTVKRNSVAVVSDGSAVLGLGNIGPHAAMPVMEGKAALFKGFADIDAWPICLDTQDVDQIVETVAAISPGFAGINLEDISAPRCFEIEARLRERLDIPVFHDDQHGTAVVVLAALRNALQVVGKDIGTARIVLAGAGAAGTAVLKVLIHAGAKHVVVCDVQGVVHEGRDGPRRLAAVDRRQHQRRRPHRHVARRAARRRRVHRRERPQPADAPRTSSRWPTTRSSSRWPTPTPRSIRPSRASTPGSSRPAARTTPTRSTTCWPSPGIFRGLLDAQSHGIGMDILIAAAEAIAGSVSADELNANYIVPSVFHADVHKRVAAAVRKAAEAADGKEH